MYGKKNKLNEFMEKIQEIEHQSNHVLSSLFA